MATAQLLRDSNSVSEALIPHPSLWLGFVKGYRQRVRTEAVCVWAVCV